MGLTGSIAARGAEQDWTEPGCLQTGGEPEQRNKLKSRKIQRCQACGKAPEEPALVLPAQALLCLHTQLRGA